MTRNLVVATIGGAAGIALLGLMIAWLGDRDTATAVSSLYYIAGCVLFLVGLFPTGGVSVVRGTVTRRRPMGSRLERPTLVVALLLIGLGLAVDLLF